MGRWAPGALVLLAIACLTLLFAWRRPSHPTSPLPKESEEPSDVFVSSEELRAEQEPRGVIAGRVTDPAMHAIAGAAVCAFASSESTRPRCVTTDADGRYRMAELLALRYHVDAAAQNHQPARWRDATNGLTAIDLAAGSTREGIDLILVPGGVEVRGRVNDISGGPVRGAIVTLVSNESRSAVTESNANGEWQAWVAPGPLRASAMADGYATATMRAIAPGQFIELALTPESVLEGRVVEAGTDTPVPGARVSVASGRAAFTDADGRFRLPGLEPGRYKPEARGSHRWGQAPESILLGLGETTHVTFTLGQGETKTGIRLELAAHASVRGKLVMLDGGAAISGLSVSARPMKGTFADRDEERSVSDDEGRFELSRCPAGRVYIDIWAKDRISVPVTIAPGRPNELPPIRLVSRLNGNEAPGGLGMVIPQARMDMDLDELRFIIAGLRPGGAVERAGILIGDEIVSVDGYDVTGQNTYLLMGLIRVPAGTTLNFGLRRGVSIPVTTTRPNP
jgi:hypothetical protein